MKNKKIWIIAIVILLLVCIVFEVYNFIIKKNGIAKLEEKTSALTTEDGVISTKDHLAEMQKGLANNGLGELIWEDPEPFTKPVNTFSIPCDYSQYEQINILYNASYYYQAQPRLAVAVCNIKQSLTGWQLYNLGNITYSRTVEFNNNTITANAPRLDSNMPAYAIPIKIFGIKSADMVVK